jgi:hypothetical protein
MSRRRQENDLTFVRQGTFVEEMVGWQDYNDLATKTTPITLTTAGTWYELTNDGAGPYTQTVYRVLGKGDIWDASTNSFDFSELFMGGIQLLRTSLYVDPPSSNVEVEVRLRAAIGTPSEYSLPLQQRILKSNQPSHIGITTFFTIDNEETKDNPAKLEVMADADNCTVEVDGWKILTLDRF